MSERRYDPRACLSHWHGRLAAVAPVPRTRLVVTQPDLRGDELLHLLDGREPDGYPLFMARLEAAVAAERAEAGSADAPVFLRTGQSAFRDHWKFTCGSMRPLAERVAYMVQCSGDASPVPLPLDVWAVREMLPTEPVVTLDRYGGLPVVPQLRAFIGEGDVLCAHSYWPMQWVADGLSEEQKERLDTRGMSDITLSLAGSVALDAFYPAMKMLREIAKAFAEKHWSVDLLETRRGWVAVGMAPAYLSWHDPSCPLGSIT